MIFCYVGCQYVGVTGAVPEGYPNPGNLPVIKHLSLVHTRADCPVTGTFFCSNDIQNKAHKLIDWSIKSNMSYVATDCPHREKNGWQEQNWHMARAISYCYDVQSWFNKIDRDIRDTQLPDGHVPTNCPNFLVGIPPHGYWNEAPEWGISSVFVPWHLYEWYGDRKALDTAYESMKRYVDYLSLSAKDGVINSNLGDWYDYGHGKGDGPSQWTPTTLTATAIWAMGATTVMHAAEVLGQTADVFIYDRLQARIKEDFQRRFYDPVRKSVLNHGSCQAANCVALCAGLIPEEDRKAVLQAVVEDLERRNYQQTVGEVMQVFLIRALAEGGRSDVLDKIYSRENQGSYGYMVKQGLTTLPESWDAKPGTGNSMNHYMLGHLVEWHYAYVAGIRQQPGKHRVEEGAYRAGTGTHRQREGRVQEPRRRDRREVGKEQGDVHDERHDPRRDGRDGGDAERRAPRPEGGDFTVHVPAEMGEVVSVQCDVARLRRDVPAGDLEPEARRERLRKRRPERHVHQCRLAREKREIVVAVFGLQRLRLLEKPDRA